MITTVITSAQAPYTNVSTITFTITFSEAVTGFIETDVTITGGDIINFSGSGDTYTVITSPTDQGSIVTLFVAANVAEGALAVLNDASNTLAVGFNSIKPIPTIVHSIPAITASLKLKAVIQFDRDVTGFDAADFVLTNCTVSAFAGSGSLYNVTITPITTGDVQFSVAAGVGTDVYGNVSVASSDVTLYYDGVPIETKKGVFALGEIGDPAILGTFELGDLRQAAAVQTLADCAKNIPQRLLIIAQNKAFEQLMKNPTAKGFANQLGVLKANVERIQEIADKVHEFKENPETLKKALLEASGLSGDSLVARMQQITDKFGAISGLDGIINKVMESGFCGGIDYYSDGAIAPRTIISPTNTPPNEIPAIEVPILSSYDSKPKDAYNSFMFQLKEHLETESSQPQTPDRAKMISTVNMLGMGFHDTISKTTDNSKDQELFDKYKQNVEYEKTHNAGWPQDLVLSFETKAFNVGDVIFRNSDTIRAFYNRNASPIGTAASVGVTVYSTPDKDFTTFLDVKPSQRPPELTAYWTDRGYNIPAQEAKLTSRGMKLGTLDYSDSTKGSYGNLKSDFTVASSRFPGGSVILLRNPDGSIYNPTGKNPLGQYTVTDTGNAAKTYAKPDIFTHTPNAYTNMESVQVFLVNEGTQTGPQYKLAQSKYANKPTRSA